MDNRELHVLECAIDSGNASKNRGHGDESNLGIESCRSNQSVLICHNAYG